jgi:hypothetical protein
VPRETRATNGLPWWCVWISAAASASLPRTSFSSSATTGRASIREVQEDLGAHVLADVDGDVEPVPLRDVAAGDAGDVFRPDSERDCPADVAAEALAAGDRRRDVEIVGAEHRTEPVAARKPSLRTPHGEDTCYVLGYCRKSHLLPHACPHLLPRMEQPSPHWEVNVCLRGHAGCQGLTWDEVSFVDAGDGNRPPVWSHVLIYAGNLATAFQFKFPTHGARVANVDGLFARSRSSATFLGLLHLGWKTRGGRAGTRLSGRRRARRPSHLPPADGRGRIRGWFARLGATCAGIGTLRRMVLSST